MMLRYEDHYASKRPDGRHTSSLGAQMAMLRDLRPKLALPNDLTKDSFKQWQTKVIDKHRELLCLPDFTPQPKPVMLSSVRRDGYRVEKWEFYPDDYTAVPFLALIPDGASKAAPVPAVMCFPGSNHSKELLAGEPQGEHPNLAVRKKMDRNTMALHYVRAGMAAFAFDHPAIGECSALTDPEAGETQFTIRNLVSNGYMGLGWNYMGVSVFQKLCFMEHLRTLDYVDQDRIAVSGHSLGTGPAIALGLLCDDVKAVVFNDFLCDELRRHISITEQPENGILQLSSWGTYHILPGLFNWYGFQDLCAAFAPRWLTINEGGADEVINTVRRAYDFCDASDRLQIAYYPCFSDPASRTVHEDVPKYGLTMDDYYVKYSYVEAGDHSFRKEPSVSFLRKCFNL